MIRLIIQVAFWRTRFSQGEFQLCSNNSVANFYNVVRTLLVFYRQTSKRNDKLRRLSMSDKYTVHRIGFETPKELILYGKYIL